ncbi:MAG: hypothetical protein KQJ78_18445 [Deltaproteobacteria bacterium]|nr:hypothetical protein [Deltaproteobacteria bacterium]
MPRLVVWLGLCLVLAPSVGLGFDEIIKDNIIASLPVEIYGAEKLEKAPPGIAGMELGGVGIARVMLCPKVKRIMVISLVKSSEVGKYSLGVIDYQPTNILYLNDNQLAFSAERPLSPQKAGSISGTMAIKKDGKFYRVEGFTIDDQYGDGTMVKIQNIQTEKGRQLREKFEDIRLGEDDIVKPLCR